MKMFLIWSLVFGSTPNAPNQRAYKIETGMLGGALYKIAIPKEWNRKLIIHAHGGRPEKAPLSADFKISGTYSEALLEEGWMIAETSYRRNGVFVQDGVEDVRALYEFIAKHHSKPLNAYIIGASMGGKIALRIAEEERHQFDGILAIGAALLCEDNDISMCEDKSNLDKLKFQPNIPILFYSNINEIDDIKVTSQ